jgi:CRP-like cAMP-binding protein
VGTKSLDNLSPRTLQELCRRGDRYTVWPGQTVLAEGSRVQWVFLVLDGELVLRRRGKDLEVLRAGCLYGALETLHHTHAPADLVARDVTRVLALPVNAYTGLVQTHPDLAFWVLCAVARQQEVA